MNDSSCTLQFGDKVENYEDNNERVASGSLDQMYCDSGSAEASLTPCTFDTAHRHSFLSVISEQDDDCREQNISQIRANLHRFVAFAAANYSHDPQNIKRSSLPPSALRGPRRRSTMQKVFDNSGRSTSMPPLIIDGDRLKEPPIIALSSSNSLCSLVSAPSQGSFGDDSFCNEEEMKSRRFSNTFADMAITTPSQIDTLLLLELEKAQHAFSESSFYSALEHFLIGVNLLPTNQPNWTKRYHICLKLYTGLAKASYCLGDFDTVEYATAQVFQNANQLLSDRLPCHRIHIQSLGAMGKLDLAVSKCISVLHELGEWKFHHNGSCLSVMFSMIKTKITMRNITDEDIVNLPLMTDPIWEAKMEFLNLLLLFGMWMHSSVIGRALFRMLRITMRRGISRHSALAFALYGSFTCGVLRDMDRGYQYGRLAFKLLDRVDAKDLLPRVSSVVYNRVNHWKEHIQKGIEPTASSVGVALDVGDNEYAMMNAYVYCVLYYFSGLQLSPLEEDLRKFCGLMAQCNQTSPLGLSLPFHQLVLNLTVPLSEQRDPVELTGEVMDHVEHLKEARLKKNSTQAFITYHCRMELAYFFGKFGLAASLSDEAQDFRGLLESQFIACRHTFFDGLVSYTLAQRERNNSWKRRKWKKRALRNTKRMKILAKCSALNCIHLLKLLEAERAVLNGHQPEEIQSIFSDAISTAGRHGFLQDKAISLERLGMHYVESPLFLSGEDSTFWASHYYTEAYKCYLEWGATAKAQHLKQTHAGFVKISCHNDGHSPLKATSKGWRSRGRFSETLSASQINIIQASLFSRTGSAYTTSSLSSSTTEIQC